MKRKSSFMSVNNQLQIPLMNDQEKQQKSQCSTNGQVRKHFLSMIQRLGEKDQVQSFINRTQDHYEQLQKIQEQKEIIIERIFVLQKQEIQGDEQVRCVYEDIGSKQLQNYYLMLEYEDLQVILNEYLQNEKENGQRICEQLKYIQCSRESQSEIKNFKDELRQLDEDIALNQIEKQCRRRQIMQAIEREKKNLQDIKIRQDQLNSMIYARVDQDCDNMLKLYVSEKGQQLKDIRIKYGRQYYDKLIQEVRSEFRDVYSNELKEMHNKFRSIIERSYQIQSIQEKNNRYLSLLQKDVQQFKNQLKFIPSTLQKLQLQASNLEETEQQYYQIIELMHDHTPRQNNSIYHELQGLKYSINELESNIIRQNSNININQQMSYIKQQLSVHKKSLSCIPNSTNTSSRERLNSTRNKPKQQVITDIPQVQIELHDKQNNQYKPILSQCTTTSFVSNPKEILESIDSFHDEPKSTIKKTIPQNNSYLLSFNQHPLQDTQNKQSTQLDKSINIIKQFTFDNSNISIDGLFLYIRIFQKGSKLYDPIEHYNKDPVTFGFQMQKFKFHNHSQEIITYESDLINDKNENMVEFNKKKYKILRSDITQFKLGLCSENALKFQKIYQGIGCQDSLALRHLRVRLFPFSIILSSGIIYEGLALCKENITKLESFFNQILDLNITI